MIFCRAELDLVSINKILHNLDHTAGSFLPYILYKGVLAIVLLGLSCLGNKRCKNEKITWKITIAFVSGSTLFFLNTPLLKLTPELSTSLYIFFNPTVLHTLMMVCMDLSRIWKIIWYWCFNSENEKFLTGNKTFKNEYSINSPTKNFNNREKWNEGWINVVNPFQKGNHCSRYSRFRKIPRSH